MARTRGNDVSPWSERLARPATLTVLEDHCCGQEMYLLIAYQGSNTRVHQVTAIGERRVTLLEDPVPHDRRYERDRALVPGPGENIATSRLRRWTPWYETDHALAFRFVTWPSHFAEEENGHRPSCQVTKQKTAIYSAIVAFSKW